MKITICYETQKETIELEVSDNQCEIWVEADYQRRLSEVEDKSSVERRSAQEIMEEEFNKPIRNNQKKESRRHVHLEALDPENKHLAGGKDPLELLIEEEEKEELYAAIKSLQPQQIELVYRIVFNKEKMKDVAAKDGVSPRAITGRMKKIIERLKKILE